MMLIGNRSRSNAGETVMMDYIGFGATVVIGMGTMLAVVYCLGHASDKDHDD